MCFHTTLLLVKVLLSIGVRHVNYSHQIILHGHCVVSILNYKGSFANDNHNLVHFIWLRHNLVHFLWLHHNLVFWGLTSRLGVDFFSRFPQCYHSRPQLILLFYSVRWPLGNKWRIPLVLLCTSFLVTNLVRRYNMVSSFFGGSNHALVKVKTMVVLTRQKNDPRQYVIVPPKPWKAVQHM